MSVESYIQYNNETQMQNYEHNERGISVSYYADAEAPRLPFFGREDPAGGGIGALLNPALKIGFVVEGIGTTVSI